MRYLFDSFKETKIWKHFTECALHKEIALVEELSEEAFYILDRIVLTFPTYTLHNGQHQLNILNLYEKILQEKLRDLTAFESAILILSAFYHDIGMAYTQSDKDSFLEEDDFKIFLEENHKARLLFSKKEIITDEIAAWYCRWDHAKRVRIHLRQLNKKLVWGNNFHFEDILAEVCISHNEKVEYIKNDSNIPNDCLLDCSDMKFCSILLRLADILDFDNTRAPISIYKFLDLDNIKDNNDKISQNEWKKHFSSEGFSFNEWNQEHSYTLDFQANPSEPIIEKEIYDFLDYIEKEFAESATIIRYCGRWRHFILPNKINRLKVLSQGYTFGNFKFSLDQDQIISLLVGENLYTDPFVFIRELLQNAIDTSRHRKFYEINKYHIDFEQKNINISTWHDEEGFRWIRIDDFGMGMNFSQIINYFLKVGNSYYNSEGFEVEKLNYKTIKEDFVPISRFGIGILSCFIACDIIEVNTKSLYCDNNLTYPIRLSLKGKNNYYTLQTNKDTPSLMPNNIEDINIYETNKGYRKDYGTSIAVRINAKYDTIDFDLSSHLKKLLINPEVKINLIGKGLQGEYLLPTSDNC